MDPEDGADEFGAIVPETLSSENLSPGTRGLLERARRLAARGTGDTASLEAAVTGLETAAREGDRDAVAEHTESLLDLLYELDEE